MSTIDIDPTPGAALSPHLYMQFMEPLGSSDSSVSAAWDAVREEWRADFLAVLNDLKPGAIRWGGILSSYWKWREGIGPYAARQAFPNFLWGGIEPNHVGVHEILDLCRKSAASPIIAVNFAADGRPEYLKAPTGENRAGTPEEAADLVRYCNDPDHSERRGNGQDKPWNVAIWQVGNETSYPPEGQRFDSTSNAATFQRFARTMRQADPSIKLIGWGDRERKSGKWWAPELLSAAGDDVDLVAIHMMHQRPEFEDTVLAGERYRKDYDKAWVELGEIYETVSAKLGEAREVISVSGSKARLAITEGHLSLRPHNKCPILREWIAGLYHARIQNLYERNADLVEIATFADFFGTVWTVNAVMFGSRREAPYLMPAGKIARLYRRNGGDRLIKASTSNNYLDIAASRRGRNAILHIVNTDLHNAQSASFRLTQGRLASGEATMIAPGSPSASIYGSEFDELEEQHVKLSATDGVVSWSIPAGSVSAIELQISD